MFLTGDEIANKVAADELIIGPFRASQIGPASYDFTLGETIGRLETGVLDPERPYTVKEEWIPDDGIILVQGETVIAHTKEIIHMGRYLGFVQGTTTYARCGLFVNLAAPAIHPGFRGQVILELHATKPILIRRGVRLAQLFVAQCVGKFVPYKGIYNDQMGATGPKGKS
jgi:deoxycytidine triphosphate deaminase